MLFSPIQDHPSMAAPFTDDIGQRTTGHVKPLRDTPALDRYLDYLTGQLRPSVFFPVQTFVRTWSLDQRQEIRDQLRDAQHATGRRVDLVSGSDEQTGAFLEAMGPGKWVLDMSAQPRTNGTPDMCDCCHHAWHSGRATPGEIERIAGRVLCTWETEIWEVEA